MGTYHGHQFPDFIIILFISEIYKRIKSIFTPKEILFAHYGKQSISFFFPRETAPIEERCRFLFVLVKTSS